MESLVKDFLNWKTIFSLWWDNKNSKLSSGCWEISGLEIQKTRINALSQNNLWSVEWEKQKTQMESDQV